MVQGEEFGFEDEVTESYRDMVGRLARDPVGQTLVFELMIRLFFVHVLGARPELIGHRRGGARDQHADQFHDGMAAGVYTCGVLGAIAAAFGAVEAQGRGSLHPHILVWLVVLSLQELLDLLLRDRATFKARVGSWMREVVRAVLSVQQSAVEVLPQMLQGQEGERLPPLLFGPKERYRFRADGAMETATLEE